MTKRAVLLALVVSSNTVLDAQFVPPDITKMSGGVSMSAQDVQITAESAEYNRDTEEIAFFGTVTLRPLHRPLSQVIPATNRAGAPFPEPKPVLMRVRGDFQISIGNLTIRADEADVNAQTGETELRGNVKVMRSK